MSVLKLSAAGFAFALACMPLAIAEETAPPATTTATANTDEDPVVCKRVAETGSRLGKKKICKPKSEWEKRSKSDQDALRTIQQKGVQPGGETLQPG
jgi:hypothetical protein